jgi:predicted MFS family arabinose efflux permease
MNFDHGAIPAALVEMKDELGFSKPEMGSLGSYVYLGFVVGAILNMTVLTNRFSDKTILCWAFVLNGIGAQAYIYFWNYYALSFARFVSGFGQILLSIYNPLFVDTFCTGRSKAIWLPIVMICGPFGTCFGYSLTGALTSMGYRWTIPFLILALSQLVCFCIFLLIPSSYVNLKDVRRDMKVQ